jgi:Domain of unknown function (DUF397)
LTTPSDPEVAVLAWRKASLSHAANNCVELAPSGGMVYVRDSQHPDGPILTYAAADWQTFLAGAKKGRYDIR